MKVVLIGTGNVATQLAQALVEAHNEIVQIYSRSEKGIADLSALLKNEYAITVKSTTDFEQLVNDADIYIVSLTDTALAENAAKMCHGRSDRFFVHTAGSVSMQVFKGYCENYGVMYPMQTFSKARRVDFSTIPVFIEANTPRHEQVLDEFCRTFTQHIYHYTSEQRKYLHLGAVLACNFTNHLYALCADVLKEHDIPFEIMLPLIDETVAKIHEMEPVKAQTGPAVRNDRNVIDKHLTLLDGKSDVQEIYELLSKSIHNTNSK